MPQRALVTEVFLILSLATPYFLSPTAALCDQDCLQTNCSEFSSQLVAANDCYSCTSASSCNPDADDYDDLESWCTYYDCNGSESRCSDEDCIAPVLISDSSGNCESNGYETASTADECETLAELYQESFVSGNLSGSPYGCTRYQIASTYSSGNWRFSDASSSTANCSGGSNDGYECLCKEPSFSDDENATEDGTTTGGTTAAAAQNGGYQDDITTAAADGGWQDTTGGMTTAAAQDGGWQDTTGGTTTAAAAQDGTTGSTTHGTSTTNCENSFEATMHYGFTDSGSCTLDLAASSKLDMCCDNSTQNYDSGGQTFTCFRNTSTETVTILDTMYKCDDTNSCEYSPIHAIYSMIECPTKETTPRPTTPYPTTNDQTTPYPTTLYPTTLRPTTPYPTTTYQTTPPPTTEAPLVFKTTACKTPEEDKRGEVCGEHYACEVVEKGTGAELECDCGSLLDMLACVPPCFCEQYLEELKKNHNKAIPDCPTLKDSDYVCNANYTTHLMISGHSSPSASPSPSSSGENDAFDMSMFLANGPRRTLGWVTVAACVVSFTFLAIY